MKALSPRHTLETFVLEAGSQRHAAKALGVSPQYLSDILAGRRSFSQPVLKKLGLKTVVVKVNGGRPRKAGAGS